MGNPIFEILTNGKEYVQDIKPDGEITFGGDIIRAFQFRLGTGSYWKGLANLSEDWEVKVVDCK